MSETRNSMDASRSYAGRLGHVLVLPVTAEAVAARFHALYEQLARNFGYETRRESAKPWPDVPEENRRLMVAVCDLILDELEADRA